MSRSSYSHSATSSNPAHAVHGHCHRAAEVCHGANGHRLISTGQCWVSPLQDQHCPRKPHRLPTRFGVSIFPMHMGVRERATAKQRPTRLTCGHTSTLTMTSRAQTICMMLWRHLPVSLSFTLCDSVTAAQASHYKIDEVSFLSNIAYTTEGIHIKRAYIIGSGKLVLSAEVDTAKLPALSKKEPPKHVHSSHSPPHILLDRRFSGRCYKRSGSKILIYYLACLPRGRLWKNLSSALLLLWHLDCVLVLQRKCCLTKQP